MIADTVIDFIDELRDFAAPHIDGIERRGAARLSATWPILIRGRERDVFTETSDVSYSGIAVKRVLEMGEAVEARMLITPDTMLRFDAEVCRTGADGSGLRITRCPPAAARSLAAMSGLAGVNWE